MSSGLIVPVGIRQAVLAHAGDCAPEECCGLLAGDGTGRLRFAYLLTNVDRSPNSFTIDETESYHAFLHAAANGWDIRGAFHSHPTGPDSLSDRDIAEAQKGWIHLLAFPGGLKAFQIMSGEAVEIPAG